jgi:hypothetical protein
MQLVRRACSREELQGACESLEDVLMAVLDAAGEPERVLPTSAPILERASEELRRAALEAAREGLEEESRLLEDASRRLAAAAEAASQLLQKLLTSD